MYNRTSQIQHVQPCQSDSRTSQISSTRATHTVRRPTADTDLRTRRGSHWDYPGIPGEAMMRQVYKPDDLSRMRVIRFPDPAPEKEKWSPATSDNRRYWAVTTIACITWMCMQIIARKFLVADSKEENEAHVGRSGGVNYSSPSLPFALDLPICLSHAPRSCVSCDRCSWLLTGEPWQ
jgi:hypothetical protein